MKKCINNMKKNIFWNTLGTGFSAFNSLFFMIIVTRINGLNDAGIFTLAFSTACILYIIGTFSGRVYQVTDITNTSDKEYCISRVITCLIMIIVIVIFVFMNKYDLEKSLIFIFLTIFKSLEAFSEILYGIMQKNNRLEWVGKSLFIKSLFSVILFFAIDYFTNNLLLSCLVIIFVWLSLIIILDFKILKNIKKIELGFKKENLKNIFVGGFSVFIVSFLNLIILNLTKYVIDLKLSYKMQAIFGIIIMPATAISLFAQFVIHPFLNKITLYYKEKKYKELKLIMYKIILLVLTVGFCCSLIGYLIGIPVLEIIYGVDLSRYRFDLFLILLASTFSTTSGILSSFLITMRYNVQQVIMNIIIVILELILSVILTTKYKLNGACISYFISMIIGFVMFYFITINILKKGFKKEN